MAKQIKTTEDPEITAISEVYIALKDLDSDARARVLNYVSRKFNISSYSIQDEDINLPAPTPPSSSVEVGNHDDELEGISPAGRKWIARNGIAPSKLMTIFSLGIDEIDLVSKSVPGTKKAQRMKNVFLLKGIAAYLGTGAPRFTHEQMKEACLHYDAFDAPNFSTTFKSMAADVSGGKDTGYTLTARGMAEAAKLVKGMLGLE